MTLLYVFLSSYGLELKENLTKVHSLFIFPYFFFYRMPFCCSRIPSRIPYYIYSSRPLRLHFTMMVSQTFLVFNDLDSFKEYHQIVRRITLDWDLSDFLPSWIKLWIWGRKNHKGRVSFLSHQIKNIYYWCDSSLLMLTLVTQLWQCLDSILWS